MKILIIDDDAFMARLYQTKFEAEGFEVAVASDGIAAQRELVAAPPDIVLLDLVLPGMSGVDVLQFIRARETLRDLPVLVLSNSYAGNLLHAARAAGANRCLTKASCTPRHVVEEVRAALATGPRGQHLTSHLGVSTGDENLETQEMQRRVFAARISEVVAKVPSLAREMTQSNGGPNSAQPLLHAIHSLRRYADLAGFGDLALLASSLEALLHDLRFDPRKTNASTLRTIAQAVSLVPVLFEQDHSSSATPSPLILVVDDDIVSRATICAALERANLRAVGVEEPALALKLTETNRFDLIFLDVEMPILNGFELCQSVRATPINANTPVVFVTGLTDFDTRAQSSSSGGSDFVAKPIVPIELAVKAVTHLFRGRLARASTAQGGAIFQRAAVASRAM